MSYSLRKHQTTGNEASDNFLDNKFALDYFMPEAQNWLATLSLRMTVIDSLRIS
jgi:hypothetical protein